MNLWNVLKSLITFQPPPNLIKGTEAEVSADENLPLFSKAGSKLSSSEKSTIEKIWFDNIFRIWISFLTFFIVWILWIGGTLPSFKPVIAVYLLYLAVEISVTWLLLKTQRFRQMDFVLCFFDIVGVSIGIYLTGGANSPLYFLYFIPVIIQAFHRDWALILFYGFGSVIGYSVALFFRLNGFSGPDFFIWAREYFLCSLALGQP